MKAPSEKNGIGKFLSKAEEKAGIQIPGSKLSNHSVRKTCRSRGYFIQTHQRTLAELRGHNNIESPQSYKSASEQH